MQDYNNPNIGFIDPIEQEKSTWRLNLKERLDISVSAKEAQTIKVVDHLKLLLAYADGPVAAFSALKEEPSLTALFSQLDLDWCFPKVSGETLCFYKSRPQDLVSGEFGVLEPLEDPKNKVAVEDLKWCLTPALGFDRNGVRLGRGKGFYDKSLSAFKGTLVGVGFSQSVCTNTLPSKNHDVCMNWIVTDRYLLKISN